VQAEEVAPRDQDRQLEAACYRHTRDRQFPEALSAARKLIDLRQQHLGPDHWLSIDARLNLTLVERLAELSPPDWQQFLHADELHAAAVAQQRAGNHAAALKKAEQALPIYTRLLGPESTTRLACLFNVAMIQMDLGKYFAAQPQVRELIETQPRLKGTVHPDTLQAVRLLGRFNEAIADWPNAEDACRKALEISATLAGPEHPETLVATVDLARVLAAAQKYPEAEPLLQSALTRQRKLLGDQNPEVAQTMKILGALYCEQGKLAAAEPLLVQSAEILRQSLGEKHLATAGADHALGKFYLRTDQFQKAHDKLSASLAVCLETLGEKHPVSAKVMSSLADFFEMGANPGLARHSRLKCLKIAEETYGETNLHTADALENLARTHSVLSDFGLAETYLVRAREIRRKILGEEHPQTAALVGKLAYLYLGMGDPVRAEPLFLQALFALEKTPGPDRSEAPRLRKRLALLYQNQGKFDQAEAQYRQALEALQHLAGPDSLAVAEVEVGLAQTQLSQGDCATARQLMSHSLAIHEQRFTPRDPRLLDALGVAATAHLAGGDARQAAVLLRQSLDICRLAMQTAGVYQSQRQRLAQMMVMRHHLDLYLSLPITEPTQGALLYPYVLAWKGGIAAQQWRDRQNTKADSAPLDAELQQLERRLAALTLHPPPPDGRRDWLLQIFQLTLRKESLHEQRAVSSSLPQGAPEVRTADLQNVLPPGAALIDFMQYTHTSFTNTNGKTEGQSQQRYLAFVVRKDRRVVRIDIGDVGPIAEAAAKWRKTRGFRPNAGKTDWGAVVARQIWPRLKPHLAECDTLLISPDGNLAQIPWNILPVETPDRYLIEDFAVATIPTAQLLPELLRSPAPERTLMQRPSLLLVGDVDYNAPPGAAEARPAGASAASAVPAGAAMHFQHLAGTAAEVQALQRQFREQFPTGQVAMHVQGKATEDVFRREAPRHHWLHIATHGFFAPPAIKTAIATQSRMDPNAPQREDVSVFHVDYLHGLALAGANRGPAADGADGVLTAAELAVMDLRGVDTVVLSGCETGLGELHAGEGAFGMQRALQTAGVRTTIGSLWTVSDEKTNLLMQRFYSNLWEKKLPRLHALREAQLWMLHSGGADKQRLSPHYWAAFTLSGDWR